MKSRYHHQFLLVLATAVTVVVVALYAYMYYTVGNSTRRAITARDIAGVEKLNKDQEKNLTDLYDRTAEDRDRLTTYFVESGNVVAFIEALEALEKETGGTVAISGIAADDLSKKPIGTIGTVGANITAEGSWASVMKTLMAIELLPYQISVSQVRLDSTPSSGGKGRQWHLSLSVRAALIADNAH